MKIRNGFVSNSSTSSFVAIGAWLDYKDKSAMNNVIIKMANINFAETEITDEEKRTKVIQYWEKMSDKPKEYYMYKCGELTGDIIFSKLHDKIFQEAKNEKERIIKEARRRLENEGWNFGSGEYRENLFCYELGRSCDDGAESLSIDFEKWKEVADKIKEVSGCDAELVYGAEVS